MLNKLLHPFPKLVIKRSKDYKVQVGKKDTIIAANGIFGQNNGWQEKFALWGNINTNFACASYYSWCGIFQEFQYDHANALARLIDAERLQNGGNVYIIAHSNGNELTLLGLQQNTTCNVDGVFGIAAAVVKDCNQSGINQLQTNKQLGFIVLGTSTNDGVLGSWWEQCLPQWKGKDLGLNGPTNYNGMVFQAEWESIQDGVGQSMTQGINNIMTHTTWMSNKDDSLNVQTIFPIIDYLNILGKNGNPIVP